MNTIGSSLNIHPESMKKDSDQSLQVQTNASSLRVSNEKNADMEIVTKEGDKVTLSFSSQASSGYSTYDQKGRLGDSTWSESRRSAYMESETNIEIKIEGNLNEDELKDIMKAAKKLEKAMNKLVNGNMDGAVETLLDAANGKTISSMESNLSYSRSMEIEKSFEALSMQPEPMQEEDMSRDTTSMVPPAQPEQLAQTSFEDTQKNELEKLLEDVKNAVNRSKSPKSEIKQPFENFFDRMILKAEKNIISDSDIPDFFRKLRKDFMEELMTENNKKIETEV